METLIYRIEHRTENHGPYVRNRMTCEDCRELANEISMAHWDEAHPVWDQDVNAYSGEGFDSWRDFDYYSAFISMDDLIAWFDGWFSELYDCGYVVRTYKISDEHIALGEHQIAVRLDHATKIEENILPADTLDRHLLAC